MKEEETNDSSEVNPDALDEVFSDDSNVIEEEEEIIIKVKKFSDEDDEDEDEDDEDDIDLAFHANDEKYW